MKCRLFSSFALLLTMACTKPSQVPATKQAAVPASVVAAVKWPPLPSDGFVAGRPATSDDVSAGRAAFSMQLKGRVIGKPLQVTVPQYAFHRSKSGERAPGIVIQAEEGQGIRMLGIKLLSDDRLLAALESECELLGPSISAAQPSPPK